MARRFVPAKTDCGVAYLKPVGRPTLAQEDELLKQMSGVVGFTSIDSRSARSKRQAQPRPEQPQEE
jgi:hypothetical protein